jgi:AAA15 family ATPase/GTPase
MLTRLYIDNFRCFSNFEYKPARRNLILGRNGSGKTSLINAMLSLREFLAKGGVRRNASLYWSERAGWIKPNKPSKWMSR